MSMWKGAKDSTYSSSSRASPGEPSILKPYKTLSSRGAAHPRPGVDDVHEEGPKGLHILLLIQGQPGEILNPKILQNPKQPWSRAPATRRG